MKLFADYHTHTKYSDGRGTLEENVLAARALGLEQIGISDHGPNNIGTGVESSETYLQIKQEAARVNAQYPEIKVLVSTEADIISIDGKLDVSDNIIKELDYLIVGLHPYIMPDRFSDLSFVLDNQLSKISQSVKDKIRNVNTKALTEAVESHDVKFVSHPGLGMEVNLRELARVCSQNQTALEINTGHHFQTVEFITEAEKEGATFVINSDAHFPQTVGRLDMGLELAAKAKLPPEMVINAYHNPLQ